MINIFWFRRDLRLHDNHGLHKALQSDLPVLPIFIFDTEILDDLEDENDARVTFLHNRIRVLHTELKGMNSTLEVYHGEPSEVFHALISHYNVKNAFTNRDYEPYAKDRDDKVAQLLAKHDIPFRSYKDHVIFEGKEITTNDDEAYKVYTPYKNKWLDQFKPEMIEPFDIKSFQHNFIQHQPADLIPLTSMNFRESKLKIPEARIDRDIIRQYDQRRDFPFQNGTSRLGIHLRHGTISIREAVNAARKLNNTWLQELIWRDFYIMILDNFPFVVDTEFNIKYRDFPWSYDEETFEKWCQGKTGYPMVDAGMRELNATGYMHNRSRMITASFLTKHLLIDWRWGEAYFGRKLLDYELASNNGGWQWAAGTGTDAQPYFRIFNPDAQMKRFDPERQYIKKWIPEIDGSDYPEPIIDHKFARKRTIETFKEVGNRKS